MNNSFIVILCTAPSRAIAEKISKHLVEKRLAACCNIIPGITSVYRWKDQIEQDDEVLLIIKSSSSKFRELEEAILEQHPYDVPEIIEMPITSGSKSYLDWINASITG